MTQSIVDFLEALDTNSKLMEAYKKDPTGTALASGLEDEDLRLIEEKDWDEVKRRFDDASKATRVINY